MVAAIRNVDFRQFTSVALVSDRHGMSKLALLLGSAAVSGQPTTDSAASKKSALPGQRSFRRGIGG